MEAPPPQSGRSGEADPSLPSLQVFFGEQVGIVLARAEGPEMPIVFADPGFERLSGYLVPELLGRSSWLLSGKETPEARFREFREALGEGRELRTRLVSYRKDGTRFWDQLVLLPLRDAEGRLSHLLGIHQDVTVEARSEELLRALIQRESYQDPILPGGGSYAELILREFDAGVVAVDAEGSIRFLNPAAAGALGQTRKELLGRRFVDVVGLGALDLRQEDRGGRRMELVHRRPDGREVELGFGYRTLPSACDPIRGLFVFRDLAATRLRERQEQFTRQAAALEEISSAFAHEARNPLASIRSIADLMRVETSSPEMADYAERLLRLSQRLENLVKAFLRYGQPPRPSPTRFALRETLDECLRALGRRIEEARPVVTIEPPDLEAFADPGHVVAILTALMENALDLGLPPGHIQVTAQPGTAGGHPVAVIAVRDDGPGIPAHLLRKVFRPFFSTKPRGSGLGLPIAQRLAEENHGALELQSELGVETRFTLTLPQRDA